MRRFFWMPMWIYATYSICWGIVRYRQHRYTLMCHLVEYEASWQRNTQETVFPQNEIELAAKQVAVSSISIQDNQILSPCKWYDIIIRNGETMTEKEKMNSLQPFLPNDKTLKRERRNNQILVKKFNHLHPYQSRKRYNLARKMFSHVGKSCSIYPPFYSDYGYNIRIGNNFFANTSCIFLDVAQILIGDNVMLGPRVSLVTVFHPTSSTLRAKGFVQGKPIHIENNVWIGANSVILAGVRIGNNSIIGAGSIVTKDVPPNVIAAGNPCKVIRSI